MTIHTIGDSHSYNGWSGVINHHLGPLLCYTFGVDTLNRCDINSFGLKDSDTVVFCLGEIDCRCHIHKHITELFTYQDVINGIVDKYFQAIELTIHMCPVNLKNVCVYNVVTPIQKHNTSENPEYPFLGSDNERKNYVLYFNQKLKEKCNECHYVFFDIYEKYINKNGFLKKELSDGSVHIRDGSYITQFINNNNI